MAVVVLLVRVLEAEVLLLLLLLVVGVVQRLCLEEAVVHILPLFPLIGAVEWHR